MPLLRSAKGMPVAVECTPAQRITSAAPRPVNPACPPCSDYDPAECVGALRADKPWTNIVWTFESGQVVSPFDAQDECA